MGGNYYLDYSQTTWVGSRDFRGQDKQAPLQPGQTAGGVTVVQVVWSSLFLASVALMHGSR